MLRRGRASLPSQPKELQIRMVERLQAAVVEWQSVVEAADLQPPEVSPGEEDHDPASRSPVVGKNAGEAKAPDTQKDGRRQRKKRGASRPAAASTSDDEALGAFDALQALQHEQGWDQRRNTAGGGGEDDGSDAGARVPMGPADRDSATESTLQVLGNMELKENAEEEVETPRDTGEPTTSVGGHTDAAGESRRVKLTDVRQKSQDIPEENEEEDAEEDDDSPDRGALQLGGLRSSRVSASDLGALRNTLEEGEEEED